MREKIHIALLIPFLAFIIGIGQSRSAQITGQDSLALVALYYSTNGANWTNNSNWLTTPVTNWYGITLSGDRVSTINLGNNNLSGTIPPEIGDLTDLVFLYLYDNLLSGTIPDEISNLTNLNYLNLRNNQLQGTLPVAIGNMNNLARLNLANNQLFGTFPPEIGNLTSLIDLQLHGNQLTGPIPSEIGNLNNLETLNLTNNQFSGNIPVQLGSLSQLRYLYLSSNQLSGSIPPQLNGLINLTTFWIQNNQFDDLPDLSSLPSLDDLRIADNSFTFEDIEPNIGIPTFFYSPQDSVGEIQDTLIGQGSSLEIMVNVGGAANQYQWMKDGIDIAGAVGSSFTINNANATDSGSYICRITNSIATGLTLFSRPVEVSIESPNRLVIRSSEIPGDYALRQNYPNPFNATTFISFQLPKSSFVNLSIYDITGRLVDTIINEYIQPGDYSVKWDASSQSSGIYLYVIRTAAFADSRKFILMK